MKTKTTIIAVLAIFLATNVFAAKNFKFELTPLKGSKVLISINADKSAKTTLSIVDDSGKTIYFKRCKSNEGCTKQIYNFSNLKNGSYEVKLKAGKTTLKNEMRIKDGEITINKQDKEIKPHFALENNLVKISYLNFEKNNIEASVYKKGSLVFVSELGNEFTINKALNISNMEKGYYDLCLSDGQQRYWFSLKR